MGLNLIAGGGCPTLMKGQRGLGGGGTTQGLMVSGGRSCSLGSSREWAVGVVGSDSMV